MTETAIMEKLNQFFVNLRNKKAMTNFEVDFDHIRYVLAFYKHFLLQNLCQRHI